MFDFLKRLFRGPGEAAPKETPRNIPAPYREPLPADAPLYRPDGDDVPRSMPDLEALHTGQWGEGRAIVSHGGSSSARGFSTIGIDYEDGEGKRSERVISIAQLRAADAPGEHSMIVAFCHSAGAMRHFRVDRVKGFFDPDTGEVLREATLNADPAAFRLAHEGHPPPAPQIAFKTLGEVEAAFRDELVRLGWTAAVEAVEPGDRIACYRMAKIGNRRLKHPTLELYHEPFETEVVCLESGDISIRRGGPRKRPWGVRCEEERTRTFSSLDAAAHSFIEVARAHAPGDRKRS